MTVTALRSLRAILARDMEAREFCRRWFRSTPEDESAWGYRARCIRLLAQVLNLQEDTVKRWGGGVEFEDMPPSYKAALAYADTLRVTVEALADRNKDLLEAVLENLQGDRS